MKIRLNLATAPQANHRPFLTGAVISGAVGALAFVFLWHAAFTSWEANRELRIESSRLEEQIRADRTKQEDLAAYFRTPFARQTLDRSAFLNSLIDERSFPWTKVFMDLEQTLPPGVRVVSISPRLVNGRAEVELEVGAATDDGKIRFLEAVEKSRVFSGMVVKEERHPDPATSPDRIVLDLTVWYSTT